MPRLSPSDALPLGHRVSETNSTGTTNGDEVDEAVANDLIMPRREAMPAILLDAVTTNVIVCECEEVGCYR